MEEINVNFGDTRYEVCIGSNFDGLDYYLNKHKINEKILVVTNHKVGDLYEDQLKEKIKNENIYVYKMSEGENYKTLNTVNEIYEKCHEKNFNRASAIIALGGGVVGDTAGFAASTFMRGIKLVHIPTTVIADVDSSIGGKVGVNFKNIKNMVGNFYHPQFIYINTSTLNTLEKRHIISGMAEVIKYAVLFERDFFHYLNQNINGLLNLESDKLNYTIKRCIDFKIKTIKNDVYDNKERQLLNFGHTIGHVIETMSDYSIYHGEAVAIGMMFASALSNICGVMSEDDMLQVFRLITAFGLNNSFDLSDNSRISDILKHDKKADRGNIKYIIPKKIGSAEIISGVQEEKIVKALHLLREYWDR